jgi:hypothetical protein
MKHKSFLSVASGLILAGFLFPQVAHASTIDVAFAEMNFGATSGTDQPTNIGVGAGQGFTHRYDDVITGVDAIATVIAVSNLDKDDNAGNGADNLMDFFDQGDSSSGKAIEAAIDVFGNSDPTQTGYATFRIDFVAADTNNAVTLEDFAVRVVDIDSNQFAEFAGISAYELSLNPVTELTATVDRGSYEFREPLGIGSNSSDEENWVTVEYAEASSITVTLGARESGSASFGVSFRDTTWTNSPTRIVPARTIYAITYDDNDATSGVVPASQNSTSGSSTVTLSAPQGNLLKTGCTFGGWNTRADGLGANYLDAGSITLTADITLFAKWGSCPAPSEEDPTLATTGIETLGPLSAAAILIAAGTVAVRVRHLLEKKLNQI